jgi:hypothetical protein
VFSPARSSSFFCASSSAPGLGAGQEDGAALGGQVVAELVGAQGGVPAISVGLRLGREMDSFAGARKELASIRVFACWMR